MKRNYLVVVFCLLALTACSGSMVVGGLEVKESDFQHYLCDDEKHFDVAYVSEETAILRTSESSYRLIRITSGSGAKYILDDHTASVSNPVTLYTKGQDARLEINGLIYKTCRVQ